MACCDFNDDRQRIVDEFNSTMLPVINATNLHDLRIAVKRMKFAFIEDLFMIHSEVKQFVEIIRILVCQFEVLTCKIGRLTKAALHVPHEDDE
jgi:hypothetical protein